MPDERFLSCSRDQIKQIVGITGTPFEQRVSDLLVEGLRAGLVMGDIHPEKVMQEIACLEGGAGASKTEPEKPFMGPVLKGFWKKHFFQARFLPLNLANELKAANPHSQKLRAIILEVERETRDPAAFAALLAHKVVEDTYAAKAKKGRLTGEWIIFAKHDGKNYYLTLALHGESDDVIRDRMVAGCSAQFPFLLT